MLYNRKSLTKLIVPLIVEQFLSVLMGMADTMMVTSCGEQVLSGVALVDSINLLLINVFMALAAGGAIVVAQCIGEQNWKKAHEASQQLLYVTLFV